MARNTLEESIRKAVDSLQGGEAVTHDEYVIETPQRPEHGDYSCNAAMVLAGKLGRKPRELAQALVDAMHPTPKHVERIEIAGPGFINFHLAPRWLHETIEDVLNEGEAWGRLDYGRGERVLLEYVSANPNGPIHIGHGRGGAIGDTLANALDAAGFEVCREFYINDAATGAQMRKFGISIDVRYRQALGFDVAMPEDAYHGEYVKEIAERLKSEHGEAFLEMDEDERIARFTEIAREEMLQRQRQTLERFGIRYDNWFSEQTLYDNQLIDKALEDLKKSGKTFVEDGALWFRSTDFGDDKNRVLVRKNGRPTYLASDVAYHRDKFARGFTQLIDIWGPDHHGYIARTRAAMEALGCDPERLRILVYQIVRLFSGGELVRMSKREGELVELDTVMDAVGVDVARYYFLMRSADSRLDFDLQEAKKQSADNPVYYIQYAHARVHSLLREAAQRSVPAARTADEFSVLTAPAELGLVRRMVEFSEVVRAVADTLEPHRLTAYAHSLARDFTTFYTECRVLGESPELQAARLGLAQAAGIVLRNVLRLIGVSAPESM